MIDLGAIATGQAGQRTTEVICPLQVRPVGWILDNELPRTMCRSFSHLIERSVVNLLQYMQPCIAVCVRPVTHQQNIRTRKKRLLDSRSLSEEGGCTSTGSNVAQNAQRVDRRLIDKGKRGYDALCQPSQRGQ